MIRRLILCGPYTEDEARAATLMAKALVGDGGSTVAYRVAPCEGRIIMFEAGTITYFSTGKRRGFARLLDDPAGQALAVVNAAVVQGRPVFNVFTPISRDGQAFAYSGTDAVFTIGLSEGNGVAWLARVKGGIAPGIAHDCMWEHHRVVGGPFEDRRAVRQAVRHLFFKRKPAGWENGEAMVVEYARHLISDALQPFRLAP